MHELEHLLTNEAHWAFEAITDLTFAIPAYALGRWRLKVHDREAHNHPERRVDG